eukprot:1162144-Heterocapsa_arctica.AAC.1
MIDSGCVTECAVGGASSQPQPVGKGGLHALRGPGDAHTDVDRYLESGKHKHKTHNAPMSQLVSVRLSPATLQVKGVYFVTYGG